MARNVIFPPVRMDILYHRHRFHKRQTTILSCLQKLSRRPHNILGNEIALMGLFLEIDRHRYLIVFVPFSAESGTQTTMVLTHGGSRENLPSRILISLQAKHRPTKNFVCYKFRRRFSQFGTTWKKSDWSECTWILLRNRINSDLTVTVGSSDLWRFLWTL